MRKLFSYINRVLCICAVLFALVGCEWASLKSPLVVKEIGASSEGECDCECYGKDEANDVRLLVAHCPCSVRVGDTLHLKFSNQ